MGATKFNISVLPTIRKELSVSVREFGDQSVTNSLCNASGCLCFGISEGNIAVDIQGGKSNRPIVWSEYVVRKTCL